MFWSFLSLLKKDFKLMLNGGFPLLLLGSLIFYSCYISFVYVNFDQAIYPVYLYDPFHTQPSANSKIIRVDSREELQAGIKDGYAAAIDASGKIPEAILISSGIGSVDRYRFAYALSLLSPHDDAKAEIIGEHDREMKNRREITCEFLFFELTAVGFLGLASLLFKEKQMGMIRVHGILPISKTAFILSKLCLFLLSDLLFAAILTLINLGLPAGLTVLPQVLLQAAILSVLMAMAGFFCAVILPGFKQFSLFYLILAVFITTPVFLAGQTGIALEFIKYHPMYHLFMAMKHAYFGTQDNGRAYYALCSLTIVLLFLLTRRVLNREMAKEG